MLNHVFQFLNDQSFQFLFCSIGRVRSFRFWEAVVHITTESATGTELTL